MKIILQTIDLSPVSNFNFLLKVITKQIDSHIQFHSLGNALQSAYIIIWSLYR
jgi:hypothetical protein